MSAPTFTPQLRPLSIGEVLDAGFRLLRARFGTLLLCVLVPLLPLSILGTIIIASTSEGAFDPNATPTTGDEGALAAGFVVTLLLQSVAFALAVAACFRVVSTAYLGERGGVADSLRYALRRVVPLIVTYIVLSVIVGLGLLLLIVPGLFLGVRWAVTLPAVVFERTGPFKSMGRSWKLTKGHWWRTFATLVIIFVLVIVLSIAIQLALTTLLLAVDDSSEIVVAIVSTLVGTLSTALTYPLLAAVIAVIYYDLRVRNEGFDLQLLARGVGSDDSRFSASPERAAAPATEPDPAGHGGFAPPQGPAAGA